MANINASVVVPWVLSILTASVGVYQFTVQQGQANRRPFLEQQLAICVEASDTAARLATETDPKEWERARGAFWRLYWGRLALVEDREVESAMIDFGRQLSAKGATLPRDDLQNPSIELAHSARNLILRSWDVKLPPLAGMGVK